MAASGPPAGSEIVNVVEPSASDLLVAIDCGCYDVGWSYFQAGLQRIQVAAGRSLLNSRLRL